MPESAVPTAGHRATPAMFVDLDALARNEKQLVRWTPPAVVDGQMVTHPPYRSPLAPDARGVYPTALRGGVVTDPEQIAAIRRRVQAGVAKHARRGAWRRRLHLIRWGAR